MRMSRYLYCVLLAITSSVFTITGTSGLGTTLLEGDIYVEVIAAIYSELHDNGTCSGIDSESVQNLAAIKWTFSELNKEPVYIPGAKIGVRVSETCRSVQKAKELAFQLANEVKSGNSDIMGVMGSDFSSETAVISRLLSALPDQHRLLQIGYASTSAFLSDRNIYGNFFRVIPPDDIQVEVMLDTIKSLRWTYMALIYDDDAYGIGGRDSLLTTAKSRVICFPIQIPVDPTEYNITKLEEVIQMRILNAETPVGGILVFGGYQLANYVLIATERALSQFPNSTRPVFLFSESAGYTEGHPTNISKGAFILSPPRRTVDKFQTEWVQMFQSMQTLYNETNSNKWLRDLYASNFGCTLASDFIDNTCGSVSKAELEKQIPSSVYNQYAIMASMLMAKAIKKVHAQKCGSQNGICPEMLQTSKQLAIDIMKNLSVNFDQDFGTLRIDAFQVPSDLVLTFNDSVDATVPSDHPAYEVYNHQVCETQTNMMCLQKVAQFNKATGLDVFTSSIKDYDENGTEHTWPDIRKPQCPEGHICLNCEDASTNDNTLFIPGDLYVVGVVPVHNVGPTPLKCDGIKQGGLDIVEAIRFAVDEAITVFKDKVPQASIGIIVIDGCNDPQLVEEKMLTLHRHGVYKNGAYIPVGKKIIAYVGGRSSSISAAIAAITTRLGFPQISYASTAPVLGKKSIYPYFLRVPSADGEQARVMLKMVKELNANVIQIVYSKSTYGEGGKDILLELIKDTNICVTQSIETKVSDPDNTLNLLRQHPYAKVVVMFIGSSEVGQLVKHLNEHLSRNEFLFISSEAWGTRVSVDGYINAVGSITIASELQMNDKFIDHVKELQPDGSNINPWIRPYMENYFQCYYEWSYNKLSRKKCTGDEALDVLKQEYRIDAWSPFTEKAVLALLQGTRSAMELYCGNSYTLCDNLRNNTAGFVDILRNVKLNDASGFQSRIFDDNGDGLAGYKIYAVDMNTEGNYKQIGTSEQNGFIFYKQMLESIRGEVLISACGTQDVCQQCFPIPTAPEVSYLSIGLIVMPIFLGVVCCVLIITLVCMCKRRGCCLKIENGRLRFSKMYLDTASCAADENYDTIRCSRGARGSTSVNEREDISQNGTEDSGLGSSYDHAILSSRKGSSQSGLNNMSKTSEPGPGTVNFGERTVVYRAKKSDISTSSLNPDSCLTTNSPNIDPHLSTGTDRADSYLSPIIVNPDPHVSSRSLNSGNTSTQDNANGPDEMISDKTSDIDTNDRQTAYDADYLQCGDRKDGNINVKV